MTDDEKIKVQVDALADALDGNGGHAMGDPGLIDRDVWLRIARHIPVDVIQQVESRLYATGMVATEMDEILR